MARSTAAAPDKNSVVRQLSQRFDATSYDRLLVRRINELHARENFDLCLWMGLYAPAHLPLPVVSFAQGPPGTDARALIERNREIAELAGSQAAHKWKLLAKLRLSQLGLPDFSASDQIIVGSQQSVRTLRERYHIAAEKLSASPYPVDLSAFNLPRPDAAKLEAEKASETKADAEPLRILWLGRIVPRKRLDVFLSGAALALERGIPLQLTIVGQAALIPQYEKLICQFRFPDHLTWHRHMARSQVPELLWNHDVLAQPSDEEDFGSSILEAQACGLPVIVGRTNGNADYICSRSIHLRDESYETFADALEQLFLRKKRGEWGSGQVSRATALEHSSPDVVVQRFFKVFESLRGAAGASNPVQEKEG